MLPPFASGLLPPGVHPAEWTEIVGRFAFNPWRVLLAGGLRRGAVMLAQAGCPRLWIDGSFVTDKPDPGDFDVCWDHTGVDRSRVDPILFRFDNDRALQKLKYRGEFFPNVVERTSGHLFRDFFQIDKASGGAKGIVELELGVFR